MSIAEGTYLIMSVSRPDYSVMMFGDKKEGIPIPCAPCHSWPQEHFHVKETGSGTGRYVLTNTYYKWMIGADADNLREFNYPFTSFKDFEWAIEPAGGDLFKIHIPNKDEYWYLPDTDKEQIRVIIEPSRGQISELWRFQKI